MSDQEQKNKKIAEARVKPSSGFSTIWIIPIVAVGIAAWLIVMTLMEQGPEVTVTFETAEGLEAGKTKVRMRHVEVGVVEDITMSKDLSDVVVTISLKKDVSDHLLSSTRFWVVKPRIGGGGISGLGTLISGAFIEMDPGETGEKATSFRGLELPPVVKAYEDGSNYLLVAQGLGSLSQGAPVYYQGVQVGEVKGYTLSPKGSKVHIPIFIRAPYDKFVQRNTRFWNASGIKVSVGGEGLSVRTGTLQSLIRGGISFETLDRLGDHNPAKDGHKFVLYNDYDAIKDDVPLQTFKLISYFSGSIRGLKPGASVEFRGLKIGKVVDVRMEFDLEKETFIAPVLYEIQPERLIIKGGELPKEPDGEYEHKILDDLIANGLSAQLISDNILTGQKLLDLDLRPNQGAVMAGLDHPYPEVPSMPSSSIGEMTASVTAILHKLQKLPLENIADNLNKTLQGTNQIVNSDDIKQTVRSLNRAAKSVDNLMAGLEANVLPQAAEAVNEAKDALGNINRAIDENSPLRYDISETLRELSSAARSIRLLAEYLERNPNALLYGKQLPKQGQ